MTRAYRCGGATFRSRQADTNPTTLQTHLQTYCWAPRSRASSPRPARSSSRLATQRRKSRARSNDLRRTQRARAPQSSPCIRRARRADTETAKATTRSQPFRKKTLSLTPTWGSTQEEAAHHIACLRRRQPAHRALILTRTKAVTIRKTSNRASE